MRDPAAVGTAVALGTAVAVGAPVAVADPPAPAAPAEVPRVSPVKPRPASSNGTLDPSRPVEPSEEAPAPADAVPLQTAPAGSAAALELGFESGVSMERLLPAIEAVTEVVRAHPGPLAVLLQVPVAGATRQVRLPHRVAWDDRLTDALQRAAELPLTVRLRALPGDA